MTGSKQTSLNITVSGENCPCLLSVFYGIISIFIFNRNKTLQDYHVLHLLGILK